MFHMTQWTHVPAGASGSSTMSAKLMVCGGLSIQVSKGDTSDPWQVLTFGISAPEGNAGLDIVKVTTDEPPFGCCAERVVSKTNATMAFRMAQL
jgi:hypothetical protein